MTREKRAEAVYQKLKKRQEQKGGLACFSWEIRVRGVTSQGVNWSLRDLHAQGRVCRRGNFAGWLWKVGEDYDGQS